MKRLVVVADNPLIVAAIRTGIRDSGTMELLGYADPRRATASGIVQRGADVVLVDEAESSEPAILLIRSLKEVSATLDVLVLSLRMEGAWLERALAAGANGAVSKSIHPRTLVTLVSEAISGHIVHSPTGICSVTRAGVELGTEHSSLTEREHEILQLVASGATNGEIGSKLWITQQTVKFHVSNIYRKLGVTNRTQACHYAHVNGLVTNDQPASGAHVLAPRPELVAVAS